MALPAHAEISPEVKATCMEAKDFVGCVQALSGGVKIKSDDGLGALRGAMKQVAGRLDSGTSLRDSTLTFQPVIDQLAIVQEDYPDALAVKSASKASDLFDILQMAWQRRIDSLMTHGNGSVSYSCLPTGIGIKAFNGYFGSTVVEGYSVILKKKSDLTKGGFLGVNRCKGPTSKHNERALIRIVIGVLREGAVDPEAIEKYEADRAEKYRLANMSAWERHLDKNPGMKQWAAANPAMAATEQAKFNNKNPQKEVQIPSYAETLRFLSKFNPPL